MILGDSKWFTVSECRLDLAHCGSMMWVECTSFRMEKAMGDLVHCPNNGVFTR